MTSEYLTQPLRTEHEVRLQQLHYHLDKAALAAKALADICNMPIGGTKLQGEFGNWRDCAEQWRAVHDMLSDPECELWHDHIAPAQKDLEKVFGE